MNIPAIPTQYAGVNFRSRLEARWASFFDLCGWKWEYEPLDLNGWIPDFILLGNPRPVLVEVKPYLHPIEAGAIGAKMERACVGTEWAKWDLLLLGTGPFEGGQAKDCDRLCLGLVGERAERGDVTWWQGACLGRYTGGADFSPAYGWYTGRITGEHFEVPGGGADDTEDYFLDLWKQAGNQTQWKPVA
jgi:hypothetical protein